MALIVIALGGNALGNTPQEQQRQLDAAADILTDLIDRGNEIVVSHGNGPQVGMVSLAFEEAAARNDKVVRMPLPECAAMSQGYIGFHLQEALHRHLRRRGMPWQAATLVTQVVVDPADPAFDNPSKPIGAFYDQQTARELMASDPSLTMAEDAGRGWRQVVPSPAPQEILERAAIQSLLDAEFIPIACGGGGIPVVREQDGSVHGVPAVIDKDFASECLAEQVGADLLFILTAVDHVCINFGKPNQQELTLLSADEAERYMQDGQFADGSMKPKVAAAICFVRSGKGRRAIIGSLEQAASALDGQSGTMIVP